VILSEDERGTRGIVALPADLRVATDAFEADEALTVGFGPQLAATIAEVRRGEAARFADAGPDGIVAGLLWKF
jgi:glutamine synthetase